MPSSILVSMLGEDYRLRRDIALPFLAAIILAVGWKTFWNGLKALSKINFWSINLLMTIAVAGTFYLSEYEEPAVKKHYFYIAFPLPFIGWRMKLGRGFRNCS